MVCMNVDGVEVGESEYECHRRVVEDGWRSIVEKLQKVNRVEVNRAFRAQRLVSLILAWGRNRLNHVKLQK